MSEFADYLTNDTLCTYSGDSWWPYCEKVIPFTADIYTCCENNMFKSLKIGSIDLDKQSFTFLAQALKRVIKEYTRKENFVASQSL